MLSNLSDNIFEEELNKLLQILINHQTNSQQFKVPPNLFKMLLNIKREPMWLNYMKQEEKPSSYKDLNEKHANLCKKLISILGETKNLRDYLRIVLSERVSNLPIKQCHYWVLCNKHTGSIYELVLQDFEFLIDDNIGFLIELSMRKDKKPEPTIEFSAEKCLEMEKYLSALLVDKSKSYIYSLSRGLLHCNWYWYNTGLEDKIVTKFLACTNKKYVSIVLYYKIRRDLDYYSDGLHNMMTSKGGFKNPLTVQNTLEMEEEEFEKIKSLVNDLYQISTTIISEPIVFQKAAKPNNTKKKGQEKKAQKKVINIEQGSMNKDEKSTQKEEKGKQETKADEVSESHEELEDFFNNCALSESARFLKKEITECFKETNKITREGFEQLNRQSLENTKVIKESLMANTKSIEHLCEMIKGFLEQKK